MEIYNAFFEGLDGFRNTQNGATRVREVILSQSRHPLDELFAHILERCANADEVNADVEYYIAQLTRFSANVKRETS